MVLQASKKSNRGQSFSLFSYKQQRSLVARVKTNSTLTASAGFANPIIPLISERRPRIPQKDTVSLHKRFKTCPPPPHWLSLTYRHAMEYNFQILPRNEGYRKEMIGPPQYTLRRKFPCEMAGGAHAPSSCLQTAQPDKSVARGNSNKTVFLLPCLRKFRSRTSLNPNCHHFFRRFVRLAYDM